MKRVDPTDHQSSAITILNPPHPLLSLQPPITDPLKTCKICLQEEITNWQLLVEFGEQQAKGMQLLVPCECSGSMGYVHEKCIKAWICKQIQQSGKKQAFCEICKSQLFFKMKKTKHCELALHNLSLISGCNILSSIIQLFLLIVASMVFRYSLTLQESNLLRYVLLVLICLLVFAFCLTFLLMISEAFVKVRREISHILSIQECEQLGLREVRVKTLHTLAKTNHSIPGKPLLTTSCHQVANAEAKNRTRRLTHPHFSEINPSNFTNHS